MSDLAKNVEKTNEGILKKYALVIVDVNGLGTKAFSYLVPDDLKEKIKYGSPVVVPFGTQNAVNGFVVGFSDTLDGDYKVREILDVLNDDVAFTPEYMQLLLWTAKYYVCDLNSVIQTAAASNFSANIKPKLQDLSKTYPLLSAKKRQNSCPR